MISSGDQRHYELLSELTQPGGSLSRESANTSMLNPRWHDGKGSTNNRKLLYEELAVSVVHDTTDDFRPPKAIFTAGPPGAGKSSAVATALQLVGPDRRFRVIDPDRVKDDLLRASLRDGSYHAWLMPSEVWQLHAAGERFHPRELASLVQAESGRVAGALRNDAIKARADFVMEGTLQQTSHASGMLKKAIKAGFEVTVVNVECTQTQAEARCLERWRNGRHEALAAEADERLGWDQRLGGRFVPPEFIASCFDPSSGAPTPSVVARELLSTWRSIRLITFRVQDRSPEPQLAFVQRWENGRLITRPGSEVLANLDLAPSRSTPTDRPRFVSPSAPGKGTLHRPPRRPGRPRGLER